MRPLEICINGHQNYTGLGERKLLSFQPAPLKNAEIDFEMNVFYGNKMKKTEIILFFELSSLTVFKTKNIYTEF